MSSSNPDARGRRHRRVRKKVQGTAERPRLAVFRSNRHIYVQVIDDRAGRTLASASTMEADLRRGPTATVEAASKVGRLVGERALAAASTRSCSTGAATVTSVWVAASPPRSVKPASVLRGEPCPTTSSGAGH